MAIKDSTIKRLFGISRNQCAMPDCPAPIVIGDTVVGEICHIRARRKRGSRFDPSLSAAQRDEFENLVLLCRTCHTLIDANSEEYTSAWLLAAKHAHEQKAQAPIELSPLESRQALLVLGHHMKKIAKPVRITGDIGGNQNACASATSGSVSVAIAGSNEGNISIRMPTKKSVGKYPANSIGADANLTNYIDYLCELYVNYMSPIEDAATSWGKIGKHIKNRFRLVKQSRNHLPAERFWDLVSFLANEKLPNTPVGKRHLRNGTKLYASFEEFRRGTN